MMKSDNIQIRRGIKRMKTVFMAATLLVMVCLVGCGTEDHVNKDSETTAAVQPGVEDDGNGIDAQGKDQENSDGGEQVDQTKPPEQTVAPTAEPAAEVDRSAVFELFSHMTVGWNLGNTFDSIGAGNTLSSETYWGNPKTTKEMIDAISEQGINTVRIPVTWAEHVGSAPEYTISEEWLDRVEEVVDYCLDDGMYVILDTHHEPDFWMSLAEEDMENTKAELRAIWTQVAERFQDRDEHLLFEGMNEPRTKGSANEWNGGTGLERVAVNELNGVFIDAVRAVGGNNADRCLIICTYGNNASTVTLQNLKFYNDPNIAVAVHMYSPYFFTYDADGGYSEWDGSKRSDFTGTIRLLDSFLIKKGMPVIVTEFGAVNKENTEEVIKWINDYLGAMNEYGIRCVWWDNGNYTNPGEKFGIFDRRNLTWYSQEIADALVEAAAQVQ